MSGMFDDFDDDKLDPNKFINQTTQSKGHDVSDSLSEKAISKTITVNSLTIDLADRMQEESRVEFSQIVRAGVIALSGMSKSERESFFDAAFVPRNAGRKKKNKH